VGQPGLYFVGRPFQYGFTSALIGGVGRDAEYIASVMAGRSRAAETPVATRRTAEELV
jgi:putative flavoprotein involved in K+ transport